MKMTEQEKLLRQQLTSTTEELNHANKILGDMYKRIDTYKSEVKQWHDAWDRLQKDYIKMAEIKTRTNPWPLVGMAFMLVLGLCVGLAL